MICGLTPFFSRSARVSRDLVQRWLGYYGCALELAATTAEALTAVRRQRSSVLILDVASLGRHGREMAGELKEAEPLQIVAVAAPGSKW